ncbi:MAG: hypothetical protein ACOC2Q_00550 [Spirochaetota bacterium]
MIRLRSRIAYSRPDEHRLLVQSNVARRLLFGGIAAILLISFFVSSDWGSVHEDGMIAGTIFYFVITAICLTVAGWNSMMLLDRSRGEAYFIRKLFGIRFASSSMTLSAITAVVIQGARLLREQEKPRSTMLSSRLRGHVERRNAYYKLMLETAEKLHFVEDSTDLSDLESVATSMAEFLGVSYRHEEI